MERVSPLFGFFSMDHNNYTLVSLWNVMEEWGLKLANHEHFKKHRAYTDALALKMVWQKANEIQYNQERKDNILYLEDAVGKKNKSLKWKK